MTSKEEQEKEAPKTGFAGLTSMVSNVETLDLSATQNNQVESKSLPPILPDSNTISANEEQTPPYTESESDQVSQLPDPDGKPSIGKLIAGIGIGFLLILVFIVSNNKSSTTIPPFTAKSSQSPPVNVAPPSTVNDVPSPTATVVPPPISQSQLKEEVLLTDSSEVAKQKSNSESSGQPDLSQLNQAERQSIEFSCSSDQILFGSAAYNTCLSRYLKALNAQGRPPDLSQLSQVERQSIESACFTDKVFNGPVVYNSCLSRQLKALNAQNRRPDLSRLTQAERQSIESECTTEKVLNGPAAYNTCLFRQHKLLKK